MISGVGHDLKDLTSRFGLDKAKDIARIVERGVDHVLDMISKYDIDCDKQDVDILYPALIKAELKCINSFMTEAKKLLHEDTFYLLSKDDAHEVTGLSCVHGAFASNKSALINPYKLVRGILNKVIEPIPSIKVYENTKVQKIHYISDNEIKVDVTNESNELSRIQCRSIMICTNAYTTGMSPFKQYFAPIHVTHIVTRPLSDDEVRLISPSFVHKQRNNNPQIGVLTPLSTSESSAKGRSKGLSIYTLHELLLAIRLTIDNRLLLATGDISYFANDVLHRPSPTIALYLEKVISVYYPQLKHLHLKADYIWEGVIAVNLNDVPCIGQLQKYPGIYHSLIYNGHGVALANFSGRIISDLFVKTNNKISRMLTGGMHNNVSLQDTVAYISSNRKESTLTKEERKEGSIITDNLHGTVDTVDTVDFEILVDMFIFPIPKGYVRLIVFEIYVGLLRISDNRIDYEAFGEKYVPKKSIFYSKTFKLVMFVICGAFMLFLKKYAMCVLLLLFLLKVYYR